MRKGPCGRLVGGSQDNRGYDEGADGLLVEPSVGIRERRGVARPCEEIGGRPQGDQQVSVAAGRMVTEPGGRQAAELGQVCRSGYLAKPSADRGSQCRAVAAEPDVVVVADPGQLAIAEEDLQPSPLEQVVFTGSVHATLSASDLISCTK